MLLVSAKPESISEAWTVPFIWGSVHLHCYSEIMMIHSSKCMWKSNSLTRIHWNCSLWTPDIHSSAGCVVLAEVYWHSEDKKPSSEVWFPLYSDKHLGSDWNKGGWHCVSTGTDYSWGFSALRLHCMNQVGEVLQLTINVCVWMGFYWPKLVGLPCLFHCTATKPAVLAWGSSRQVLSLTQTALQQQRKMSTRSLVWILLHYQVWRDYPPH